MKSSPAVSDDAAAEKPRLAATLGRLDQIVRRLDGGELELEDQMALYVEGCQHVMQARAIINESLLKIDELVERMEGTLELKPFGG